MLLETVVDKTTVYIQNKKGNTSFSIVQICFF